MMKFSYFMIKISFKPLILVNTFINEIKPEKNSFFSKKLFVWAKQAKLWGY